MKVCNNPSGCECPNQKFCKWYGAEKKKPKTGMKKGSSPMRKTNLKKQSNKGKQVSLLYQQLRRVYLKKNPVCEVGASVCTKQATEVHHRSGRGMNTTKVSTFCASCSACHRHIHSNPQWARENGFLL